MRGHAFVGLGALVVASFVACSDSSDGGSGGPTGGDAGADVIEVPTDGAPPSDAPTTPPTPTWSVTSAAGELVGQAVDASGVYLAIRDTPSSQPDGRLERRLLTTGEIDPSFGTGGSIRIETGSIGTDADAVYVAGTDNLRKVVKATSAIAFTAPPVPNIGAVAAQGIYVFGSTNGPPYRWSFARFDKSTGMSAPDWGVYGDFACLTYAFSVPLAIAVDGDDFFATGRGCDNNDSDGWRTLRRSAVTKDATVWGKAGSSVLIGNTIAVDADSVYAAAYGSSGAWTLDKRTRATGDLVTTFGQGGSVTPDLPDAYAHLGVVSIALDATTVYVGGVYEQGLADGGFLPSQPRVERRDKATGALVPAFGAAGVLLAGANRVARLVAVDADSLYVVGTGLNGSGVTGAASIPFVERRRKDTGAL